MSINSVSNNDQMPIFAYNRLLEVFGSLENKKLVFLGVSYRGDVEIPGILQLKHFY